MAIDATVGGVDSNSYVSLSYAYEYMLHHTYASSWSTADKESALIYATTLLDSMIEWTGSVATDTQALNWPRYIIDSDVATDEIPVRILNATCEFALHLVSNPELYDSEAFKKLTVGPIKLDFNVDDIIQVFPRIVLSMISRYGELVSGDASGINNVALVRV